MADHPALLQGIREAAEQLAAVAPEKLASLLDFAQYLVAQSGDVEAVDHKASEPLAIPRPEEESVVAAIKRLSKTYPMLDKTQLFDQTSAVMSAHVLEDIPASEAIDRLEAIFAKIYQQSAG